MEEADPGMSALLEVKAKRVDYLFGFPGVWEVEARVVRREC